MYRIRRIAGKDHAHDLGEMQEVCFPGDSRYDPCVGHWWVAFDDDIGDLVGFSLLIPSDTRKRTGYLALAGVLPAHRGHGLQLRLIKARLAHARRLGMVACVTETTDNPPSANNLIRAGMMIYIDRIVPGAAAAARSIGGPRFDRPL